MEGGKSVSGALFSASVFWAVFGFGVYNVYEVLDRA